jgi:hypothetical protein
MSLVNRRNIAKIQELIMTLANVRFGSLADIAARRTNVRFTPKSGHR